MSCRFKAPITKKLDTASNWNKMATKPSYDSVGSRKTWILSANGVTLPKNFHERHFKMLNYTKTQMWQIVAIFGKLPDKNRQYTTRLFNILLLALQLWVSYISHFPMIDPCYVLADNNSNNGLETKYLLQVSHFPFLKNDGEFYSKNCAYRSSIVYLTFLANEPFVDSKYLHLLSMPSGTFNE